MRNLFKLRIIIDKRRIFIHCFSWQVCLWRHVTILHSFSATLFIQHINHLDVCKTNTTKYIVEFSQIFITCWYQLKLTNKHWFGQILVTTFQNVVIFINGYWREIFWTFGFWPLLWNILRSKWCCSRTLMWRLKLCCKPSQTFGKEGEGPEKV